MITVAYKPISQLSFVSTKNCPIFFGKKYTGFSVNYRYRIVFEYVARKEVVLLAVGTHDVYL